MLTAASLDGVKIRSFHGTAGEEHFITVEPDPTPDFAAQLAQITARYAGARRRLGLDPRTAVFRRLFLSDVRNQIAAVNAGELGRDGAAGPTALSIVQQAPLNGTKAILLAHHINGVAPMEKRRLSPHHVLIESGGRRRLWSTRLCGGDALARSAEEQTRVVFDELSGVLARHGGDLLGNCVRTWIYVKDVDVFYGDMVRGRCAAFAAAGLAARGHSIASTGIEGACAHADDLVAMDAYSALDLAPGQLSFLNDLRRMCPTTDYGVTFERGARLAWADRAHLFISGTASIDAQGEILHPGDVLAQLDRALENVAALLGSAGATLAHMTHMIVYLRDPGDAAAVRGRLAARFPDLPMAVVHGPVCRPAWLVEVEDLAITPNDEARLPGF